jgi:hypothetical protein
MTAGVGIVLLAYNSEATIAEALHAVLTQQGEPLDILVSDDCSADGTFAIVTDIAATYTGPHRLSCHRQPRNLGLVGNLTAAVEMCGAELVVLAAGDDRSRSDRALRLGEAWTRAGRPSAAVIYSDVRPIDSDGQPVGDWPEQVSRPPWTLERLAEGRGGPLGAACAITPRLLNEPGPVNAQVRHEDRVLPFRAMLLGGPILFVDQPLLDYRVVGGVSRSAPASRYDELTAQARRRLTNMLPDARQRLADAVAAGAGPALIRLCRQIVVEQETILAMSDGKALVGKAARGILGGARGSPLLKHLARFGLARAGQLAGKAKP